MTAGVCAIHAGRTAFGTCSRCGNFVCEYCLAPEGGDVCPTCRARAEGDGTIAWERAELGFVARFIQTTRAVLSRSGQTFDALGSRSTVAALGYASLVSAITALGQSVFVISAAMLVLLATELGSLETVVGGCVCGVLAGPLGALAGLVFTCCVACVSHAACVLCGGRGAFADTLRATAYAQAIWLPCVPLAIGLMLPTIDVVTIVIGALLVTVFLGGALSQTARSAHGLEGTRALIAGWTASVLVLLLLVGFAVAWQLAARALQPDASPDLYGPVG